MNAIRRSWLSLVIVLGLLVSSALPVLAQPRGADNTAPAAGKPGRENGIYIAQMIGAPVVAYTGTVPGLKATAPKKGEKVNPYSPAVVEYSNYLKGKHQEALDAVGAGNKKVYNYVFTFNGFAAKLNEAEAAQLRTQSGVVSVTKDSFNTLDTSSTPAFLGLSQSGGVWDQLGGVGNAGENIVVGIVDSGVWPENPSFSDRTGVGPNGQTGKLGYQQIPGWNGRCRPGEAFPASSCNQKLIAAQWYSEGFGGDGEIKAQFPYEFVSARGADGHGSHTASTAAGNNGIDAIVEGANLGTISGIAPRARVAVYKACWGIPPEGGCANSDTVAAIDQAVADGVDVINYSISGSQTNFLDPVEVSFLFAAQAGVFVAASAGNSGPTASTVAHPSPWIATVAASTHDRVYAATVTLGDGAQYTGPSIGAGTPSLPVVLSTAAGLPGADATAVRLCFLDVLDPAQVTGKIVVCDRGVNARTEKSQAVKQAGGLGMILANTNVNSLNADIHFVPTVHVDNVAGAAIKAYVNANPAVATAQLSAGVGVAGAEAPFMASFSSRGPLLASSDLLKPDITAPGVDILAAMSPAEQGRDFDFLSGTSMSSPHVAGLAALLKQKYPTWSPAAIKSAYMTTASQVTNKGNPIAGGPFAYGAGHVNPKGALDPGLVYDAGFNDWLAFLCGTGQLTASYCPQIKIDPSDLNYPSIAIGELAGVQTVTRRVTNVTKQTSTYQAQVQAPAGVNVTVTPASLTLKAGETKSFTVKFETQAGATLGSYVAGALTWKDATHNVRSPLVVRPVALSLPGEVRGAGASGNIAFDVQLGYAGVYGVNPHGLIPATTFDGVVQDDPTNTFEPGGPGTVKFQVTVPTATALARFSLFDEYTDGEDDLDLYVFLGSTQVGSSGGGTSAEEINLLLPAAGTYDVYVHGWQTDGPEAAFTLFTWSVPLTPGSTNMTVTPSTTTAIIGGKANVTVNWNGLATGPKQKYLGAVSHNDGAQLLGLTVVSIAGDGAASGPQGISGAMLDSSDGGDGSASADVSSRLFVPFLHK